MPETQQTEGHAPCPTGRSLSPSPEPTPPQTPSLWTGEALGSSTTLQISEAVELPQGREKPGATDIRQACLMDRVNSSLPPELEVNSEPQYTVQLGLCSGQRRLCTTPLSPPHTHLCPSWDAPPHCQTASYSRSRSWAWCLNLCTPPPAPHTCKIITPGPWTLSATRDS